MESRKLGMRVLALTAGETAIRWRKGNGERREHP
jgi:hypothetical protein